MKKQVNKFARIINFYQIDVNLFYFLKKDNIRLLLTTSLNLSLKHSKQKMTSNTNIGQSRDQLMDQMLQLANQSNLYAMLEQTLKEILECRTLSPYLYLHKKTSLKSKFDNSKASQYICELAIFSSSVNPLLVTQQSIINKLMSICIDKYNHLKVKKFQTNQFVNFLLIDLNEKDKAEFIKQINSQKMDNENITVLLFAQIMYSTIVYFWAMKEINELNGRLKNIGFGNANNISSGQTLVNSTILSEYLQAADEQNSILKMLRLSDVKEGQDIIEKIITKVFELSEGGKQDTKGSKN